MNSNWKNLPFLAISISLKERDQSTSKLCNRSSPKSQKNFYYALLMLRIIWKSNFITEISHTNSNKKKNSFNTEIILVSVSNKKLISERKTSPRQTNERQKKYQEISCLHNITEYLILYIGFLSLSFNFFETNIKTKRREYQK